jgi:hypothetical protein
MSRRAGGPPRPRDIAKEQALVCEKWQLVHANIKVDDAMKAFLTETLDSGGVTIAFGAFDLVRQVLNPKGYVRLDHKAELSNIGAVVRHPESAWAQQGKNIGNKWDFTDSWWLNNLQWNAVDNYKLLSLNAVNGFCEGTSKTKIDRTNNAKYMHTQDDLDDKYSIPVVDSSIKYVDEITQFPDETHNEKAVLRWQTKYCDKTSISMKQDYSQNNENAYKSLENKQMFLEPYWRFALRINRWGINKQSPTKKETDDDDDSEVGEGEAQEEIVAQDVVEEVEGVPTSAEMDTTGWIAHSMEDDKAYVLTTAGLLIEPLDFS